MVRSGTVLTLGVICTLLIAMGCANPTANDPDDSTSSTIYTNSLTIDNNTFDVGFVGVTDNGGSTEIGVFAASDLTPVPGILLEISFGETGEIPIGTYVSIPPIVKSAVQVETFYWDLTDDTVSDVSLFYIIGGTDGAELTLEAEGAFITGGEEHFYAISYKGDYSFADAAPTE